MEAEDKIQFDALRVYRCMENFRKKTSGKTVLIVDDDEAYSRALCRALGRLGLNTWPASNIAQAADATEAFEPDFAIIDLHLGKEDGLQVLRIIKRRSPSVVVIVLSGYINPTYAAKAIRLGAANCLAKPIDPAEIFHAMTSPTDRSLPVPTKPGLARVNHIISHWEKNDRNTTKTAQILNMRRRTVQRILIRHGVARTDGQPAAKSTRLTKLRRLYRVWVRHVIDHEEPLVRM